MSRLLRPLLVLLLAISAGGLLTAHSNQQTSLGFPWWRDSGFIKQLGLRSEQTTKIEAIWQETRDELRAEYDELDRRETKLSTMIEQGAEEAMVIRQIDRVESARASVSKTRAVMAYRMRAVLTTAQRKQMETMTPPPPPSNRPATGAQGTRTPSASGNSGAGSPSNRSSTGSPSGPSSTSPGRATTPR